MCLLEAIYLISEVEEEVTVGEIIEMVEKQPTIESKPRKVCSENPTQKDVEEPGKEVPPAPKTCMFSS